MDKKERISDRAQELLEERADSGQIATSTKEVGRFTYQIDARYFHEDDVTAAWKDAEVSDEEGEMERAVALSVAGCC